MSAADRVIHSTLDAPEARPMIEALISEYSQRYPDNAAFNVEEEMDLFPAVLLTPPYGDFLLIQRGEETIAGGGFMYFDDETAEIKRMWTSPHHRRQGLARAILTALENAIAARGYRRIYLTTGARQPEAQQMYRNFGYTPLFDLEADPEDIGLLAFEKEIISPSESILVEDGQLAEQQKQILKSMAHQHPQPTVRLEDWAQ